MKPIVESTAVVSTALALILVGCGGSTTSAPSTVTKTVYGSSTTAQATPQAATPSYKVVATAARSPAAKSDGKPMYFIVIDPVDLSNDSFKQTVKLVLQAVAKTSGSPDFSADVCDDEAVAYSDYTAFTVDFREPTDREQQHTVAMYIGGSLYGIGGQASTADDAYEIVWYPAAFADTPNVVKYSGYEYRWKA